MSKFVAVVFPSEEKIPQAILALRDMHGGDGIKLYGSAVVARDPGGKLSVQEITKEGHGGAAVGASTTLGNSAMTASPQVLTMRPSWRSISVAMAAR